MRGAEYVRSFIKELQADFAKNMLSEEELAKSDSGIKILQVRAQLHNTIERWKQSENPSDHYATLWDLNDQNVMWLYNEQRKYQRDTDEGRRAINAINELFSAAYWQVSRTVEKKVIDVDEQAKELFKTHILPHVKRVKSITINLSADDNVLEKASKMYKLKFEKLKK